MEMDEQAVAIEYKEAAVVYKAGLAVYIVAGSFDRTQRAAAEYNARKIELEGGYAPCYMHALIWWNDRTGLATLRVRPGLVQHKATRERLVAILCQGYGQAAATRLSGGEHGWRFCTRKCGVKQRELLDKLAQCLTATDALSLEVSEQPQRNRHVAKGDAQVPQSDRKDESLMKPVYSVLVCERAVVAGGTKKEDGALLEGYAPKIVSAADAVSARMKVVIALVEAKKYGNPDDPDVSIKVCGPFVEAAR